MRSSLVATLALAVAACATTPGEEQKPAAVESRQPGADKPAVAAVDLTQGKPSAAALLRDPNNILSKRSVFYDFDKYDIKDTYRPMIEAHAKYLRENPATRMLIQGNTDERGSREYNIALGQRRSEGVRRSLVLLGARDDQIEAVSLGEEKPKAQGSGEEAWAQNRRSDMLYPGEY